MPPTPNLHNRLLSTIQVNFFWTHFGLSLWSEMFSARLRVRRPTRATTPPYYWTVNGGNNTSRETEEILSWSELPSKLSMFTDNTCVQSLVYQPCLTVVMENEGERNHCPFTDSERLTTNLTTKALWAGELLGFRGEAINIYRFSWNFQVLRWLLDTLFICHNVFSCL